MYLIYNINGFAIYTTNSHTAVIFVLVRYMCDSLLASRIQMCCIHFISPFYKQITNYLYTQLLIRLSQLHNTHASKW